MVRDLSPFVDAFITDTFDPKTGASGATGKTHDWRVSRRLVELADRPIILAGGLTPDNVKRAILEVRPAGVDSHTGVEDSTSRKSREKVKKFFSENNYAFALFQAKLWLSRLAGQSEVRAAKISSRRCFGGSNEQKI